MIRPEYICNNCTHKSYCKYAEDVTRLLEKIDIDCQYYGNDLPVNLAAIHCDYKRSEPLGGIK